jgi:hypothetical protein
MRRKWSGKLSLFAWEAREKPRGTARLVGVPAEIRFGQLTNINRNLYLLRQVARWNLSRGTGENHENLITGSRSPNQDLNPRPSEYGAWERRQWHCFCTNATTLKTQKNRKRNPHSPPSTVAFPSGKITILQLEAVFGRSCVGREFGVRSRHLAAERSAKSRIEKCWKIS